MSKAAPFSRLLARCLLAAALVSVAAPALASDSAPMPTDATVLFLHHSTGGVIWGGGVPEWFDAYNAAHGTSYAITEQAYPDSPYPWDNYPYDYWSLWVQHAGATAWDGQATLEMLTPQYDVIVFKHCFPVSGIGPDTGSPDVTSPEKTLENYELQYLALRTKLRSFPANRFVVWTGAALRQQDTTPEQAARAKAFFDWVRGTWDEKGDNIYVWDFFDLETDGGLYLTPEHASGDSHPNDAFAAEVAPLFAQRVVDVIRGRGDSTDVSGVEPARGTLAFAVAGANPTAAPARFRLDLPAPTRVELSLHDVTGRRVAVLAAGVLPAGTRTLAWDGHAAGAAPGVYFARLRADGRELTRRVVALW